MMAVPVTHVSRTNVETALAVRWHRKLVMVGDLVAQGYPQSIEGVNHLIFDSEELAEKGIVLKREDKILDAHGAVLILDSLEPAQGPLKVTWRVVQRD